MLATALVGMVRFLITADRDLLDIPLTARRNVSVEIVTPQVLPALLEE